MVPEDRQNYSLTRRNEMKTKNSLIIGLKEGIMKSMSKITKMLLRGAAVLFFVFALGSYAAAATLESTTTFTLESTTFFGGSGDQRGTGIAINEGSIYLSGDDDAVLGGQSLAASYTLGSLSTPAWTARWPNVGSSHTWDEIFPGVTATSEGVYFPGQSWSQTTDGVGGKEAKSVLVKFPLDGPTGPDVGSALWVAKPHFFVYTGAETHSAVTTAVEGGSTFIYAAGGGQPSSYFAYIIAKYDTSGNLLAAATDSTVGINFNQRFIPSAGFSDARGVAVLNGNIYAAGYTIWSHEGDYFSGRAALWKYDPSLNLQWRRKDASLWGPFTGITALGNAIYGVGYAHTPGVPNSEDYLIQKYDEFGDQVWSQNFGGAGRDELTAVVGIGSRLFAVGYTNSEGAGGFDAVIIEIDPINGSILYTNLFGGSQDDMANGAATDGTDLYVVGELRSFAADGNAVPQNDLMLLRYTAHDNDNDGIFNEVDTQPNFFSNDFSDGTTTGTIISRGDQILEIKDAAAPPKGVRIAASPSGGAIAATVSVCDGASVFTVTAGDKFTETCGSVTVEVISGTVEIMFVADDGTEATTSLAEGNGLTFEPDTFIITAPENNVDTIVVLLDEEEISLAPGGSVSMVNIDIKPGSDPNSINLGSRGVVLVAILTTDDFDASTVDPQTVDLAGSFALRWSLEDVDADGDLDMVLKIATQDLDLAQDSTQAALTGETIDGFQIIGSDSVRIVPPQRNKGKGKGRP